MNEKAMKQITVHNFGHKFDISIHKDGAVACSIDGGEIIAVSQLAEGKIQFAEKQKIKVNGTIVGLGGLGLSEEDFTSLKEAQDSILVQDEVQEHSELVTGEDSTPVLEVETAEAVDIPEEITDVPEEITQPEMPALEENSNQEKSEEYWQRLWEGRKTAIKRVDEWKRSIRSYREKDKKGQKYCVHTFRIGNNKYRFVERQIAGKGVVINPDYKILDDMTRVGGVPKQYGELMFWDYYFEDKGWQRVRVLTYNEGICLDIIQHFGFFVFPKEKEKMLKSQNTFLKRLAKKRAEKKAAKEKENERLAELPSPEK